MCSLASSSSLPWVCIGDFNDLIHLREKWGKHVHPNWKLHGFQEAVADSGLFDLGMSGYQFTWERSRGSEDWFEERLDRALASNSWFHLFPKDKVNSFEASCSYHLPIFLDPAPMVSSPRNKKFRFENNWLYESDCIEIVKDSWVSSVGMPLQNKIESCGSAFFRWGNHFSRDFQAHILDCKKKMASLRDVRAANFSMHPDKSPGPDSMNPAFFQNFWSIVGDDVSAACLNFIHQYVFHIGLNETLLILLPKNLNPDLITEFRPIALCNVIYKIVAKMLASRLKLVLGSIISKSQIIFIPGRSITDNVMISAEVMHYLKRKRQGREGAAALKIDMSKAHDRIECNFLSSIMLKMGFNPDFFNMIMLCVFTVTYKISRDGLEIGPNIPSRGLRQGDPLSPYLFIICAQGLSSLINHYERVGMLHGIKIVRGAPCLTHIFFADDCFIFFKANDQEALIMKAALSLYGAASGQRVNFNKSSISFSTNTNKEVALSICSLLGVQGTVNHGNYLGFPSFISRSKSTVFSYIRERVWKRLQGWNQKLLSRAGKEILLKTVAQALPNYVMNIYLLPMELCREIERVMNSFWWGRKRLGSGGIIWMKWDRMCKLKTHRGIGFKRLHLFNVAMLGKQGWRLLTKPNILVARLFKARYYPNTSFAEARLGSNPNYVWRSILAAHQAILRGSRIQIGGGRQTVIGSAPWLPDKDNDFISSTLPANITSATVDSLMQARKSGFFLPPVPDSSAHGSVCWKMPCAGWHKCNVDAALVRSRGLISFGAVIRLAGGDFIAAKSNILPGRFDPREAEAIGVKEALSWLKKFSFKSVVLEIDSLLVFNALHDKFDYPNGFGTIIANCRALA
ncbi:reverse transcriptase domain-containing protein [Citrus sinensis]|uniref:Reverse transcriptase domain-containing protein n=1 Tax=Citrus sinensis TaxID=2711 RepID=A0ACB8L509_CITSI|nr:reverse transcriptase domain-containing protein [Citrus sinensis]